MKTSEYIAFMIDRLPKCYVFTYADFITDVAKKEAVIKSLSRMANSVKLQNFLKGVIINRNYTFWKSTTQAILGFKRSS